MDKLKEAEHLNQNHIQKMIEILFEELVTIHKQSKFKRFKTTWHQEIYMNQKIREITKDFNDAEILQHYLSRVWNMMNSNDAIDARK